MSDSDAITVTTMNDAFFNELASIVKDEERFDFLPAKFKGNPTWSVGFENIVYSLTDKMNTGRKGGGSWEFCDCKDNSAFFIYPSSGNSFDVEGFYCNFKVDARTLGIIVCMKAFSHASFIYCQSNPELAQIYAEHYHGLREAFYSLADKMNSDTNTTLTAEQKKEIDDMITAVYRVLD